MPTCCALLTGLRAAPAYSGHTTWLGAGAGAPPRNLLGSATALRAPGLRAIFGRTYTRRGLRRISIYLPMKRTWPVLLLGWESLVGDGGLGAHRRGGLPRTAGCVLGGAPPGAQLPRQAGAATGVIGRGLQAIWRPHLQTCLAWVSRPLALEGHTKMVFMLRP